MSARFLGARAGAPLPRLYHFLEREIVSHILREELEESFERLKAGCPPDWEAEKIELEGKFSGINARWEYVLSNISPRD